LPSVAERRTLVRGRIHPLAGYNAIGHYYVGKVTDPTRCRGTQLILSEPMTWSEICARYPDEWVCFVEIARVDEHSFEFTTARLVSHAKDRDDAHDQAGLIGLHYDGVGYRFTGKIVAPLSRFWVNPIVRADAENEA